MSDWLTSIPIAHRGLHSFGAPESSIKAFQNAITRNVPIELDINLTNDEKLIVFHDDNFQRMTGNNMSVHSSSWEQIKNYTLLETHETVPLFNHVLELVNGRVPLLIEVKNFNRPGLPEKKLYDSLKSYKGEFAIQSFNPFTISWFKHNMPGVRRGQLAGRFQEEKMPLYLKVLLRNLILNINTKPDFINYNIDDLPSIPVKIFRKSGIPLLGWTIGSNEQLTKAKDICDNFVFENIPLELVLS